MGRDGTGNTRSVACTREKSAAVPLVPQSHLDAQRLIDGNDLEEEGQVAFVREVAQRFGLRSEMVLCRCNRKQ